MEKIYNIKNDIDCLNAIYNYKRPIIIWGTKAAAQIAYRLCINQNRKIIAFGDNNCTDSEYYIDGKKVVTTEEVILKYPNAIILLGTFYEKTEKIIIEGFSQKKTHHLSFVSFSVIAFLYEKFVLKRQILDEERYYNLLQNIHYSKNTKSEQIIKKKFFLEYQYKIISIENDNLKQFIKNNIGIKELSLLIPAKYMSEKLLVYIKKEYMTEQIGHLVLVIDSLEELSLKQILLINSIFFYVKILKPKNNVKNIYNFEKGSIIVDFYDNENINLEYQNITYNNAITEKNVCDSVIEYIGGGMIVKPITEQEVIIVQIFNGLANQMIMYLFGKFIEKYTHKTVIFDDSILALDILDKGKNVERIQKWCKSFNENTVINMVKETREKNSFYLFSRAEIAEVFQLDIRLLSDYFDNKSWKKYIEKIKQDFCSDYAQPFPLGQLLIQKGYGMFILCDDLIPKEYINVNNLARISTDAIDFPPLKNYLMDSLINYEGNVYYFGGWSSCERKDWLIKNKIDIQKILEFNVKLNGINIELAKKIKSSYSVILHIRRGDFILAKLSCGNEYFQLAVRELNSMSFGEELEYFVFSDDITWCKENIADMIRMETTKEAIFVDENKGKNSYIDIYLMSLGKIFIPNPRSTFSHMAIILASDARLTVNELKYRNDKERGVLKQIEFVNL